MRDKGSMVLLVVTSLLALGCGFFQGVTQTPIPTVPSMSATYSPTSTATISATTPAIPTANPTATPGTLRVKLYLVALNDNGKTGQKVGCGDSLIAVDRDIPRTGAPL